MHYALLRHCERAINRAISLLDFAVTRATRGGREVASDVGFPDDVISSPRGSYRASAIDHRVIRGMTGRGGT